MKRRNAGYSLVELMIASSIGLFGVAAAGNAFLGGAGHYRQDQKVSQMQDELSFAMAQITQDLEMAGFWSQVRDGALIAPPASLTVTNDCGPSNWALGDLTSLSLDDNPAADTAHTLHPCLPETGVMAGADILAVKRVRGRGDNNPQTISGRTYLRTHLGQGAMYLGGTAAPAFEAPYQDWEYRPRLYFIQPYTNSALESPRVPSLCRMVLRDGTPPVFVKECLAQGVENMQFEVGVDSDGDGAANYFVSTPAAADLARAVAVRVYLLVRSAQAEATYRNAKTYLVGNAPALRATGADSHYFRKTLSSQVALRNARSLQGVGFQ